MAGTDQPPRVVIVGAGFGGLTAARHLVGDQVNVQLVDRNNYHLFTPLLYQVSSALLDPSEIAQPVRSILRGRDNFHFRVATVRKVDLATHALLTDHGRIEYDYLILAAGSSNHYFGNQKLAAGSNNLKELDAALKLRNTVLRNFEELHWEADPTRCKQLMTFAVIGGGPTGVEYAGALSELVNLVLHRDCRDLDVDGARIVLLEGTDRLLAGFAPGLAAAARRTLERKGVEIWFNALVRDLDEGELRLADGRTLSAGSVIWTAGVRASTLASGLGATGRSGAVEVEATLQLPGHPEVFVVGDMAAVEQDGRQLPMLAPVAIQEAELAASNVRALVQGRPLRPFRYRDKGMLATIGRNAAVADVGPVKLHGFFGWVTWLLVHLLLIVSLRNRLLVLVNWAWDYFFYDRPVRLILRAQEGPESRPNQSQSWLTGSSSAPAADRASA